MPEAKVVEETIWVEERSFVFHCLLVFLRSLLSTERDPLAVLAMAMLFHNGGDREARDLAFSRVEQTLRRLPDISDSGMQLRDCLLASGYYLVASQTQRDRADLEPIVLDRIRFAAQNEWFQDSTLACVVALLSAQLQFGSDAQAYVLRNIDSWLNERYLSGVCLVCMLDTWEHPDRAVTFFADVEWSKVSQDVLPWALLALGRLERRGFRTRNMKMVAARELIGKLGGSPLVLQSTAPEWPLAESYIPDIVHLDMALSALALNAEGFDTVLGVTRNQKESLASLLALQRTLAAGGKVVSKQWLAIFQFGVLGFLVLAVWELLRVAGIGALPQVLIEVLVIALISALGYWIFDRGSPAVGAVRAILGDTQMETESEGELRGNDPDHTA